MIQILTIRNAQIPQFLSLKRKFSIAVKLSK